MMFPRKGNASSATNIKGISMSVPGMGLAVGMDNLFVDIFFTQHRTTEYSGVAVPSTGTNVNYNKLSTSIRDGKQHDRTIMFIVEVFRT